MWCQSLSGLTPHRRAATPMTRAALAGLHTSPPIFNFAILNILRIFKITKLNIAARRCKQFMKTEKIIIILILTLIFSCQNEKKKSEIKTDSKIELEKDISKEESKLDSNLNAKNSSENLFLKFHDSGKYPRIHNRFDYCDFEKRYGKPFFFFLKEPRFL